MREGEVGVKILSTEALSFKAINICFLEMCGLKKDRFTSITSD
jgi:hypothetical protein